MSGIHRTNRRFLFTRIIAIMLLIVGFNVCHANGSAMENPEPKSFYIYIGDKAEANLLRKVRSLKIGTSVEEVKSIIGEPTDDQMLIGKKGEFHARALRYYIRKLDTGVNEIHDRYVILYFDEANKLVRVGYKPSQLESQTNDKIK
jgi:outer membrane protein assembly factor BamE (lipoprotein component of BamABCDE complex)